jgi:squamous cell carcinoma antigen recognized by T-cells 3
VKNLDWPEAIWEAWILFEHLHGSVELVDACLDKVEKAQYQVNIRRAKVSEPRCEICIRLTRLLGILKEAEKASYQAMQVAVETQAASVPVTQASVPEVVPVDEPMTDVAPRGTKRGADDSQGGDGHKRARIGEFPLQCHGCRG